MRLGKKWFMLWIAALERAGRMFMPGCKIVNMDGRRLECECGVKLEPDNLEASRGMRLDNMLDKWNAHRAGREQNGH